MALHTPPSAANDPLAQGPLFVPQRPRNRQQQQQQQVKARTTGINVEGVAGGEWGPPKPMLVAPPIYGGAAVGPPSGQQGSAGGGAQGGGGNGADGDGGQGDGSGDGPSVSELARRFSSEGWVYVGSVETSEAGPQGQHLASSMWVRWPSARVEVVCDTWCWRARADDCAEAVATAACAFPKGGVVWNCCLFACLVLWCGPCAYHALPPPACTPRSGMALDPDGLEEEEEEDDEDDDEEEEEDDAAVSGPAVATPGPGTGAGGSSGSTAVTPRNTGTAGTQATAPPASEEDAEQLAASPPIAGIADDGEGGSGAGAGAGSGSGSSGGSAVRGTRLRRYRRPGGRRGARTPRLLTIRGVRVSAEGGVYLEAKATALELSRLPASGSTASEVAELVAEEEEEGQQGQQGGSADGGMAMHVVEEGAGGSSGGGGSRRRAAEEAGRRQGGRRQGRGGGGGNSGRRARARARGAERVRRALRRRLARRLLTEDRYEADTGAWPYRVVGQLTYKKGSSTWACSGGFGLWTATADCSPCGQHVPCPPVLVSDSRTPRVGLFGWMLAGLSA